VIDICQKHTLRSLAKTKENGAYVQTLHALDITKGLIVRNVGHSSERWPCWLDGSAEWAWVRSIHCAGIIARDWVLLERHRLMPPSHRMANGPTSGWVRVFDGQTPCTKPACLTHTQRQRGFGAASGRAWPLRRRTRLQYYISRPAMARFQHRYPRHERKYFGTSFVKLCPPGGAFASRITSLTPVHQDSHQRGRTKDLGQASFCFCPLRGAAPASSPSVGCGNRG